MTEKEREDVTRLIKRSGQAGRIGGCGLAWAIYHIVIRDSRGVLLAGMPISNVFVIIGCLLMLFGVLQERRILKQLPKPVGESA